MKANKVTPLVKRKVQGQVSWPIRSQNVEAWVTEMGGHLGPVVFDRSDKKIQPYSVAPWAEEKPDASLPPILQALRGDFFCAPFGGNGTAFRGEKHPAHGETANGKWVFESIATDAQATTLHVSLKTTVRPGQVDKKITLVDGQNVVYSLHTLSGMSGPMDLGHHAMLHFPDRPGSGLVSVSPFTYGQVFPQAFESPENRGYNSLLAGAEFSSLEKVPLMNVETTDLTRYPARRGFEDLVMMVADSQLQLAWTAVVFPQERYAWFALRNPKILRNTVFWISNGGRHYPPWNGRHTNRMGLEDVTANFHLGLAESAKPNPLSEKGFETCLKLNARKPLDVPYIMGIAFLPAGFERVVAIEPEASRQGITLVASNGKRTTAAVNVDFLNI
jgi:hypothetical protein